MPDNIRTLKEAFEDSLEDAVLARRERRDLRLWLAKAALSDHQRKLMLGEVKAMAMLRAPSQECGNLLEWLYDAVSLLQEENKSKVEKPRVYFSPGTACREAICSQIRFAKFEIRICVFTISDDEITAELLAAHRRRVNIRIITDDDKTFDTGSDILQLERAGIKIVTDRSPVHMHHKFALIDQEVVLTGSYNWTRSAAVHNYENIVVLQDPSTFKTYEQEFEQLWKKLS